MIWNPTSLSACCIYNNNNNNNKAFDIAPYISLYWNELYWNESIFRLIRLKDYTGVHVYQYNLYICIYSTDFRFWKITVYQIEGIIKNVVFQLSIRHHSGDKLAIFVQILLL